MITLTESYSYYSFKLDDSNTLTFLTLADFHFKDIILTRISRDNVLQTANKQNIEDYLLKWPRFGTLPQ